MIKKILITGCGGMLGSSVYPYLKSKGYEIMATDIDINESWLKMLDVRDFEKAKEAAMKFNPDIILHLAALTSLEYCEQNPESAYDTNYLGTLNMAKVAQSLSVPLVYISTAGVFDGKKKAYTEKDKANPINVYGKTKFYGELVVENLLTKYFIIRAGWMVGGGPKKDKKFFSFIANQVMEGKKVFNVVNDTFGNPTYTKFFAHNLELLMNTKLYGKYHMTCPGNTNRLEITKYILHLFDVPDAEVNEVSSDFFKKDFFVNRPRYEVLINSNLQKYGINFMGGWKEALKDYVNTQWSHVINQNSKNDVFDKEEPIKTDGNQATNQNNENRKLGRNMDTIPNNNIGVEFDFVLKYLSGELTYDKDIDAFIDSKGNKFRPGLAKKTDIRFNN